MHVYLRQNIYNESTYSGEECCAFSGKKLAISAFTVVPHILKHTGLGALKGLELAASTPVELFTRKVKNMRTSCRKIKQLCASAATVAGVAVGIVVAVPGLLIGGAIGFCRSLCKLPKAMQTSWNSGFCAALDLVNRFYTIDKNKIAAILSIGSLLLIAASIGGLCTIATTPALVASLLLLSLPVILGGAYTLNSSLQSIKISKSNAGYE
jgi:hypothetical protein